MGSTIQTLGILPWLPQSLENRTALYKKKTDSSPFTFQAVNINGEMRLLFHTNITFGKGAFKKGKAVIDMHTGKIFAQLITQKPHRIDIPGHGIYYLFGGQRQQRKNLLSADTKIEAKTYIELNHPHILDTVFHGHITTVNLKGQVSGEKFERREIIVEHCLGDYGNLLDNRKFTGTEAVQVASQFADGISYMHRNGYFHLDVKPDNLLVDTKKKGKVADFGCSIYFPEISPSRMDVERLNTVLGERRLIPQGDIRCIQEACAEYKRTNTSKAFGQITNLLGKIDVWMFSSVIRDILETYSYSITNPKPLSNLLAEMEVSDINRRPTIKEVYRKLKDMNIISKDHSSAASLDRAYESCAVS